MRQDGRKERKGTEWRKGRETKWRDGRKRGSGGVGIVCGRGKVEGYRGEDKGKLERG